MDTSQVHHVSLCAGYGGIDLGLRRAVPRLRTIAYSEIEGYACANLVAKIEAGLLDPAPIWTDVKSFPYGQFHGCVHILSGGYPCQPFSTAGKRLGRDDPRHLWPWIADGIDAMRPTLCFFENVEGHITLGLRDVINDLGELGYRTTWGIFSAAEVGAPHQRKRVFILAYRDGERGQLQDWWRFAAKPLPLSYGATGRNAWPSRPGEEQFGWEPPRVVANTKLATDRSEAGRNQVEKSDSERSTGGACRSGEELGDAGNTRWDDRDKSQQYIQISSWRCGENNTNHTRQTQPSLGGNSDGNPCGMDYAELCVSCDNRTDELRLLGNGVVPATAALAFKTLFKELI